jgi:hypothetical protein
VIGHIDQRTPQVSYPKQNMTKSRSQLNKALKERLNIRFRRRFEKSDIRGYVLDIGPKFFLLALVSDRIHFDGFELFRINDVHNLRPDPYADFAEAALNKRRERIPRKPKINVQDIEKILLSAGRAFPLVTIHREKVDPRVCWIGRIFGVQKKVVSILEINPHASWDAEPTLYRLSEITRVNFGGDYENALYMVGGEPPRKNLPHQRSLYLPRK